MKSLKKVPAGAKGLSKLPTGVRNKMGYMEEGGKVKQSFGAAFKAARQSGQRTFEYNGKKYGTRLKNESDEKYNAYLKSRSKTKLASKASTDVRADRKAEEKREAAAKAAAKAEAKKPKGSPVPRSKREDDLMGELKAEATKRQAKKDTKAQMDAKKPKSGSAVSRSQREDQFIGELKAEATKRRATRDDYKKDKEKLGVKKPGVKVVKNNPKRGLTAKAEKAVKGIKAKGRGLASAAKKPDVKGIARRGKAAIAEAQTKYKARQQAKKKAERAEKLKNDPKFRQQFLAQVAKDYDRKKGGK